MMDPPPDRSISESLFEGSLEIVDSNLISGWAWNSAMPNSPVRVDVFADGELVVVGVLANRFRQDLLEAGKGQRQARV